MVKIALVEPFVGHFFGSIRHILSDFVTAPGNNIDHLLSLLTFNIIKPTAYFPLHLSNLATPLLQEGEDVRIFDENIERGDVIKKIIRYDPDIIGFSCKTSPTLIRIDEMSRELKNKLNVPIIFGGHHPTITPRQTLETTIADYIIIGEGDEVFLKLVKSIKSGKKLPKEGIGYKKKGKAVITKSVVVRNLNSLPVPDVSIFKVKKYHIFPIQRSRGCIRQCSFCYYSAFNCPWRMKTVERVIKEIEYFVSECEVDKKILFFSDENFVASLKDIEELCSTMQEYELRWFAMIDKCLNNKLLTLMKKAGADTLYMGVDYNTKVVKGPTKRRDIQELINFSRRMQKHKIKLATSFIVMNVDQTRKDLEIIYKLILKMKPAIVDMNIHRPYPNTANYFEALKRGFQPPQTFYEWGRLMDDILNLRNLNRINFTNGVTERDVISILIKTAVYNWINLLLGQINYTYK